MKRILILVLILSLLMIPTAQADESPMRKLTLEATVCEGELDVRIYADMVYPNDATAFESVTVFLSYSSEILELIESVKTDKMLESDILDDSFLFQENTAEAGVYKMSAFSAYGNAGTGLLLHLRFRIIGEGYYGFRLAREDYSVYDSKANQSTSYRLPRMDIDAEVSGSEKLSESLPEVKKPSDDGKSESTEPAENGFLRFLRSIFGSSCFGG